jgi:hypothetical protein
MRMREDRTVAETGDGAGDRGLALSGQESIPRLSLAAVARQREDFLTLAGDFLPVVFGIKNYLNGYYTVDDIQGTIEDWENGLGVFRWSANLTRVGTENEVDIESRLSGSASRQNNFLVVGERTHAPAIGHAGYWTDATVTSAVARTGEEGVLTVYRGLGTDISPRWTVAPESYGAGRVKFFDDEGIERAGDSARLSATAWELNNGLMRVRPLLSGGVLEVSAWSGGAWRAKAWDVLSGGVSLGTFQFCSVLNNQYESVAIRLMKTMTSGRLYLDLVLRRGYRFVEMYVQHEYGTTLKIQRATADSGSNALGGTIVDSTDDGDGNRYIVGSARTFVPDIVNGGFSVAGTTVLDAFIGAVVGGSSAVAGDAAVDLQKQYIGAPTEFVQGVKR